MSVRSLIVALLVAGCGNAQGAPLGLPAASKPPMRAAIPARPTPPRSPVVAAVPTPAAAPAPAPESLPLPGPAPEAAPAPPEMFRTWVVSELLQAMKTRPVLKLIKRFNKAEPVYWLELEGGLHVGFKPQTLGRPHVWKNDVIAFEAARLLGFGERVPPVTVRNVPLALLKPTPEDELKADPTAPKTTFGSVIFWMPVLEKFGLTGDTGKAKWGAWLDQKRPVPPEHLRMASQMSSLIIFDYLQANMDRYMNSSNLRVDEHNDIVFRDNNEGWNSGAMERLGSNAPILNLAERFSKKVVSALHAADAAAMSAALAPWAQDGKPLLHPTNLEHYLRRRKYVLEHIQSLIAKHGEDAVLAFP